MQKMMRHKVVYASTLLAVLLVAANSSSKVFAKTIVATRVYQIDQTKMWVTMISAPDDISSTWGQTTPGTSYVFSPTDPHNVRFILTFTEQKNKVPEAKIYLNHDGKNKINYEYKSGTIRVNSNKGYPYLVIYPNMGTSWVVNNKTNYNITIAPPKMPKAVLGTTNYWNFVTQIEGSKGTPDQETEKMFYNPHPTRGYRRFVSKKLMKNSPPFRVQPGFLKSFPYLGFGNGNINWFIRNPNALYFNVVNDTFNVLSPVGLETAGIYQTNSLTLPPNLDFETPYAFYSFIPKSRYAQLVVRSHSYFARDPFAYRASLRPETTFRYSWTTSNYDSWNYSLQVAGFLSLSQKVHVGNYWFWSIKPNQLPHVVSHTKWPLVTFVSNPEGYPGSEGIYFYSSQTYKIWPWMLGLTNHPPRYLSEPGLPSTDALVANSTATLPVGFSGEYSADYFRQPSLYISPVDNQVHLKYAQGGYYNLGNGYVLVEKNLNNGPFIDGWTLAHAKKAGPRRFTKQAFQPTASLYTWGPYMIYSNNNEILIANAKKPANNIAVKTPYNSATWHEFVKVAAKYRVGRSPFDLRSWIPGYDSIALKITHAKMEQVSVSGSGFSLEVEQSPTSVLSGSSALKKINGKQVVVSYSPGHWSVHPLSKPRLTISKISDIIKPALMPEQLSIVIHNGGGNYRGSLTIRHGSVVITTIPITIIGGQTKKVNVDWTPTTRGLYTVFIPADSSKAVAEVNVPIQSSRKADLRRVAQSSIGSIGAGSMIMVILMLVIGIGSVSRMANNN